MALVYYCVRFDEDVGADDEDDGSVDVAGVVVDADVPMPFGTLCWTMFHNLNYKIEIAVAVADADVDAADADVDDMANLLKLLR